MTTMTHLWNETHTEALVHIDNAPAGIVKLMPPWRVFPRDGGQPFDIAVDADAPALALLKAFISLDELARGVDPDRSTKAPPPFAKHEGAWLYTQAKVRRQSGLDYDEWSGKQFAAANVIYRNVVRKYGDAVPDPEW